MSYDDYDQSKALADYPFHALIMAAIRAASSENLRTLQTAFPDVYRELVDRWNSPEGRLFGE